MSKTASTLTAGRPSARSNKATTLASLADEADTKRVNFELPASEHTKLKIYAAKQGKTIKDLLTEYVAGLPE
jgi:hypothetical protein